MCCNNNKVPHPKISPTVTGEVWGIYPNPTHTWYADVAGQPLANQKQHCPPSETHTQVAGVQQRKLWEFLKSIFPLRLSYYLLLPPIFIHIFAKEIISRTPEVVTTNQTQAISMVNSSGRRD